MDFPSREVVDRLRRQFPTGCRIVLDCMNDPYHFIPPGTQGVCHGVDDVGSLLTVWDDGNGSLSVAYGADRAHRVTTEDEIKVSLNWMGKRQKNSPTGGHCPRCGTKLDSFERHALSRRADIVCCNECGIQESLEDVGLMPRMPLNQWWCVQNNWEL